MRWPRQVASAAALTAMLVGPPLVLTYAIGWPLPAHLTQGQLHQWVSDPLTEETLTAGLALLAWMLWLLVVGIALRAAVTRAATTIRRLRRVPLPTPMQATATGMAGAAALWAPTTTATATVDQPAPTPTSTDEHPRPQPSQAAAAGVDVPGGWIPTDTAHQIAAAGAAVWLRRRRVYLPQPPGRHRDDSDLTALPPTVTAVQATLAATPASPVPSPVIPTGGVGLTGPGAADAARGFLITTLLQALRPTGHPTTVVTSRTDLHTLLGPHTPPLHDVPGLTVTDTPDDAITVLMKDPSGPPPTLLTHAPTDPTTAARLTTALTHTTGTLVGHWTPATWHIASDGRTANGGGQARLCVLTATAALDLLAVLAPTRAPTAVIPRQRPAEPTPPPEPAPAKTFALHVLGTPILRAQGQPIIIRRSAALQILVALAVHPAGLATRDLATMIWPGLAPHTVNRRLYTTLSDLRKDITTSGHPHPIDHTDDRYHLNHQQIDVDLWQLHAAIAHAATTVTHPTHAYQTIIDHYTGDIAVNHSWPWLDPIRESTRRHVIDSHTALARDAADPTARLLHLQDALHIDPYNEDLHDQAARALITLGRPHDAETLLGRYHQRLTDAGLTPPRLAGGQ
ncbi:DNA-binding transcriptional activator of the SARP family [Micromonospora matsumotoense]|uniref:DNA-binding transcriptional activator of the SARP family n=1 Tax=Micromonospora matsumotoense TaxID=121616 RepID=A0A1C5ACL2_9ACTN|nr:BTAD domain-containing putative transcriptional regulator [Micromonospora matsumotoense]SCF42764.1 DNA-binding transcriptional activator of the SARP family [Micromonospora matsumotoense]